MIALLIGVNLIHLGLYATTKKEDIFSGNSLQEIAVQTRGFDSELSRGLIALDRILKNQSNKTVSKTTKQDREALRVLIEKRGSSLSMLLGGGSEKLLESLTRFASSPQDRESLLGFTSPQTYLVVLQNTAEKRPNGGFFGSFAKIVIDRGVLAQFEIIDSYVPTVMQPDAFIMGPEWIDHFLPEREIYFVGANKIGFTYRDASNIKKLYERAYLGEKVRGVVFVTTDLLTTLMPSLQKKFRERQFTNACVDIIRGESRSGKKEHYMRDSLGFLELYAETLIKQFLKSADSIIADHKLNIYLDDVSGPLHSVLREGNLTTRFEDDTMYFWDSNIAFNKIDQFITKTIRFYNQQGDLVKETTKDIVPISDLKAGNYRVTISYLLNVPEQYLKFIESMKQKYGISLTEREEHIFGLDFLRGTRGVVYINKQSQASNITGNIYHHESFETPFSNNVYYKSKIKGNGMMNVVELEVLIP